MVTEALTFYKNHLKTLFVSNIEGDHVREVIKECPVETTLFIIVSKTFTTQETISNAKRIKKWFLESGSKKSISKHFVAVSTNIEKVLETFFSIFDLIKLSFSYKKDDQIQHDHSLINKEINLDERI